MSSGFLLRGPAGDTIFDSTLSGFALQVLGYYSIPIDETEFPVFGRSDLSGTQLDQIRVVSLGVQYGNNGDPRRVSRDDLKQGAFVDPRFGSPCHIVTEENRFSSSIQFRFTPPSYIPGYPTTTPLSATDMFVLYAGILVRD